MSMKKDVDSINEAYKNMVSELNLGPQAEQNVAPTQNNPIIIKKIADANEEECDLNNSQTEDQAYMAKNELYKTYKTCKELHDIMDDQEQVEPWVLSKISVAANMLDGVRHYIEYNKFREKGSFNSEHEQHQHDVASKIKMMLQGESKDIIESILRQTIFHLEALQTIEETKK